jgi:hypothetical protein
MVVAINAGLDQDIFSLSTWEENASHTETGGIFHFNLPTTNVPSVAFVRGIGHGELKFHVAVNPTARSEELRMIEAGNAGLHAGDAFVVGYLERKDGKWLQTPPPRSYGRPFGSYKQNGIKPLIASMQVAPNGFIDHGPRKL